MHVLLRPAYDKLIFSKQGSLVVSSWEKDPFGVTKTRRHNKPESFSDIRQDIRNVISETLTWEIRNMQTYSTARFDIRKSFFWNPTQLSDMCFGYRIYERLFGYVMTLHLNQFIHSKKIMNSILSDPPSCRGGFNTYGYHLALAVLCFGREDIKKSTNKTSTPFSLWCVDYAVNCLHLIRNNSLTDTSSDLENYDNSV